MTTKITIDEYLSEYLRAKYGATENGAVDLPDSSDLYHLLWDLMGKRPASIPVDTGNLELVLPERRAGKDPLYYNYLSVKSEVLFCKRVKQLFDLDFHAITEEYYAGGMSYFDAVQRFCVKYNISSISEDALHKNIYRWKNRLSMRRNRRKYDKNSKKPLRPNDCFGEKSVNPCKSV